MKMIHNLHQKKEIYIYKSQVTHLIYLSINHPINPSKRQSLHRQQIRSIQSFSFDGQSIANQRNQSCITSDLIDDQVGYCRPNGTPAWPKLSEAMIFALIVYFIKTRWRRFQTTQNLTSKPVHVRFFGCLFSRRHVKF